MFGEGFALVTAPGAEAEAARATREARESATPLRVVMQPEVAVQELYGAALTLVRPDQHVAWRGERWEPSVLRRVAGFEPALVDA